MMKGLSKSLQLVVHASNLSVVGRYVLPAKIMQLLEQTPKGAGNEIQLTDAIAALQKLENVEAYRMKGQTFDCGEQNWLFKSSITLCW